MFDVNDDAKGEYRRVEVLTGPGRRRRWSADGEGTDCRGDPGTRGTCVRGCATLADLFAAGLWLATRDAPGLAERAGKRQRRQRPASVPIVSEAIPAATVQRAVCGARDRGQACRCGGAGLVRHGRRCPIDRGRPARGSGLRHPDHDQCPCLALASCSTRLVFARTSSPSAREALAEIRSRGGHCLAPLQSTA